MNVLVTGAFGNVGTSTVEALIERGHQVRCFDIKTWANRRKARRLGDRAEIVWGDLRNPEEIADAVVGQDRVIHLAFIIPKMSATGVECEACPEWAREINVGGTRNLLRAMQAQPDPPKLIFASSLHVYGQTQDQPPPRTVSDPVQPIEHYARHKIECEAMVKASGLDWSIFRFAAVLPLSLKLDPGMFDVPLDNRMEFVHTRDVGLALAKGVSTGEIWGQTLLIGGGPDAQFCFGDIAEQLLGAMGVGMLPEEAFSHVPFCTDWLDTSESQQLLDYQQHSFADYTNEMREMMGFRRHLVRLFRPIVRQWLLHKSPYYRRAKGDVENKWAGRVAVVTGASGGIGAETAQRLAQEGLKVALVARRETLLQELSAHIQAAGGKALAIPTDLADEQACLRVVRQVRATYGPIDVLVNNAGLGWYGFGDEMPWEIAQQIMQVNITALVRFTLLALPEMKTRDRGHIVNIGSIAGSLPSPGAALYSATKSFVDTLSSALHREVRGTNVHISVVRPGAVSTDFFETASNQAAAMPMPAQRFSIPSQAVVDAIWSLLQKPRRVAYVPRRLWFIPWIELYLGWLLDRLGPTLLRWQRRSAQQSADV